MSVPLQAVLLAAAGALGFGLGFFQVWLSRD